MRKHRYHQLTTQYDESTLDSAQTTLSFYWLKHLCMALVSQSPLMTQPVV